MTNQDTYESRVARRIRELEIKLDAMSDQQKGRGPKAPPDPVVNITGTPSMITGRGLNRVFQQASKDIVSSFYPMPFMGFIYEIPGAGGGYRLRFRAGQVVGRVDTISKPVQSYNCEDYAAGLYYIYLSIQVNATTGAIVVADWNIETTEPTQADDTFYVVFGELTIRASRISTWYQRWAGDIYVPSIIRCEGDSDPGFDEVWYATLWWKTGSTNCEDLPTP